MSYQLHHGDCLAILPTLEDCSVDAIVADPPAGIAFMGKAWDRDKGGKTEWIDWMFEVALQCRRVIKPGGHALVWAIPRTSHWTGSAWEDAGWQVRDKIYHVFGSGFPKSLDVSKAIDKAAGAERAGTGEFVRGGCRAARGGTELVGSDSIEAAKWKQLTAPATPEAKQWAGWGTALKPAAEEWWLFRRPLEGTVAANVLKHGTGAINVDGCRVGTDEGGWAGGAGLGYHGGCSLEGGEPRPTIGRWPANFTHDGSDEVTELFPQTTSGSLTGQPRSENKVYGSASNTIGTPRFHQGDSGSAARFFYCAKASKADRDEGCEGLEAREAGIKNDSGRGFSESDPMAKIMRSNHHPTVKPVDLMTYLCRLITPPGGTILDPFAGSGSTGKAAIIEDFKFIGIEREAEYIEIARARLDAAVKFRSGFLF